MMRKLVVLISLFLAALMLPLFLRGTETAVADASNAQSILRETSLQGRPTDQIIIKFVENPEASFLQTLEAGSELRQLSQIAGVTLYYTREMSLGAHVLKLPQSQSLDEVTAISKRLMGHPDVVYAEPDRILQHMGERAPELVPNDPLYGSQWHYIYTANTAEGLNLPAAWNITTGSASTVVAVIDTGVLNHTDLAGKQVAGYDFIGDVLVANDGDGRDGNASDPGDWITSDENASGYFAGCGVSDSSWHGTHVAGTIAAATNNGVGVAGVNWNAKILPIRVLGKCGGYTSDIVDGARWAAGLSVTGVPANANPAKVLNLSLGGFGTCSTTEQAAYTEIYNQGVTTIVAAGNSNADAAGFSPASCNHVVTVAANDRNGGRAYYSNYGSVVEITAPGGAQGFANDPNGVLSTLNAGTTVPAGHNYIYYQGTSMAAPHVAGLASLILAEYPTSTPAQILQRVQASARPFPAGSTCNTSICGAGIADAYQALIWSTPTLGLEVYLPVVVRAAAQAPPTNLVNGNFEQQALGWTEFSLNGFDLIVNSFPGTVTPRSGSWAVWLGGADEEISYIAQQVTVSPSTPYLVYYHWIASQDVCGYDFGGVIVNGATVDVYDLCQDSSTVGWVRHSVNLSSYVGQTVTFQIRAETDSSLNSNLFVDDVSFQSSALASSPTVGLLDPAAAAAK